MGGQAVGSSLTVGVEWASAWRLHIFRRPCSERFLSACGANREQGITAASEEPLRSLLPQRLLLRDGLTNRYARLRCWRNNCQIDVASVI
jgi:hypothetical protein